MTYILCMYIYYIYITLYSNIIVSSRLCRFLEVAIITGATSGVGLEAARVLAANGAATWRRSCRYIIYTFIDSLDI